MTTLKFQCIKVSYDLLMDKKHTYSLVKELAQKGAKNSPTPSAFVIHNDNKTIVLLIYTKDVEWRNLKKLDMKDCKANIIRINRKDITSNIQMFKQFDPDIYPSDNSLILKELNKNLYYKCESCLKNVISVNYNIPKNKCNDCCGVILSSQTAIEKYYELDPYGFVKTSLELLDEFTLFDKERNLTKKEFIERVNEIESKLNQVIKIIENLLDGNCIAIIKKYIYILELGTADKIVPYYFDINPEESINLVDKKLYKIGITEDIRDTLNKTIHTFEYITLLPSELEPILTIETTSIAGPVIIKRIKQYIVENICNYNLTDEKLENYFTCTPEHLAELNNAIKKI